VIDLRFVVGHGLWILGAAVVFSAFSYYDWVRRQRGLPLRDVLAGARDREARPDHARPAPTGTRGFGELLESRASPRDTQSENAT
jgi:hypothetical protein